MADQKITEDTDLGLRHQADITPDIFIERYCEVFREHACATRDDSLNEFEKLITHVLNTKKHYDRIFELLNLDRADVFTLRNVLEEEAANGDGHTEDTLELRDKIQRLILAVEGCIAKEEEYAMREEDEREAIAKAVFIRHMVS